MRRLLKEFVCKPPTAVDQLGAAVQVYPHDYFVFGARKRAVGFKYLEDAALEPDGPVVGNSSFMFKAEDLVEVCAFCQGPVVVFIGLWFLGKFFVEPSGKSVFEKLVGALNGGDPF